MIGKYWIIRNGLLIAGFGVIDRRCDQQYAGQLNDELERRTPPQASGLCGFESRHRLWVCGRWHIERRTAGGANSVSVLLGCGRLREMERY
jgi:hypothetical protein